MFSSGIVSDHHDDMVPPLLQVAAHLYLLQPLCLDAIKSFTGDYLNFDLQSPRASPLDE